MAHSKKVLRLAAIADLHYGRTSQGALQPVFAQMTEGVDAILLCGDLTDHGLPEEGRILVKDLTPALRIPILAVLGNHDVEAGKQEELLQILTDAGIRVLDGDSVEIQGVGFAGVKGFGGGFDGRILEPWGEEIVKLFVRESLDEALKLESALARLRTQVRITLLHYAPIRATVEGEPLEVFPFLGSSRLEDPLNRYAVTAVFHGHAHHGQPEGQTSKGIPVYNVAMGLLQRTSPDKRPFRIVEIPWRAPVAQSEPAVLTPS